MSMSTTDVVRYRGRFAPSPTGPLHLGSLTTALASYLDAQCNQGQWLLRLEDIDPPREVDGAADSIIKCLASHGLQSNIATIWQHNNWQRYRDTCQQLISTGQAFYCECPRRQQDELGRCTSGCYKKNLGARNNNLRAALPLTDLNFIDRVYGLVETPKRTFDNAIIWRRDDLPAYLLAVVVDDVDSKVTDIVRGDDLLHETQRQLALYALLEQRPPRFAHIPVVLNEEGKKLSKQTGATGLDNTQALENLQRAIQHLGLELGAQLPSDNPQSLIARAIQHWRLPEPRLQKGQSIIN